MKSDYEERKQRRLDNALERADKLHKESDALSKRASTMASAIPFGQPILVGHYSEGRDRNYRKRIGKTMDKAIEAGRKAEHYERVAASAENNNAISSDDPQAVQKLEAKIRNAEKSQEMMKAANKIIKRKAGTVEQKTAELVALGIPENHAADLFKPDFCGRVGFADYNLQNNNANIRRMKQRVEQLRKAATEEVQEETINGVRIVDNADENRVQLFFDGKPNEGVRAFLKGRGFRWAPSVGAWQRQRNSWALHIAREAAQMVDA